MIVRPGHAGSALIVDRDRSGGDERLLAHLASDEPPGNAAIVCNSFLERDASQRVCRRVTRQDAIDAPFADANSDSPTLSHREPWPRLAAGALAYRLELVPSRMSIPQLRWTRSGSSPDADEPAPVSLRDVIAALESYEPACPLTRRAIARYEDDPTVSSTVLRAELARVLDSPIVLNRGLREAVLARIERDELSMSEIAIRCGRVKRDSRGNESGETSWVARRIGLLAEGGQDTPTPWVHSDVLGLIARRGLGIGPREVELG
ncbi:MAG: hypothetical protein ACLQBB_15620 [Solirubrobacteraceae bacterium]